MKLLQKLCQLSVFQLSAFSLLAQVTISGVADKTIYTTPPTILIVTNAGYASAAQLDGQPAVVGTPFVVNKVDYHELRVFSTNDLTQVVSVRLVRFIVRSAERAGTEDGLPPWTPYPLIPSAEGEFAGGHLRIIVPERFPEGMPIPVVAWVINDAGRAIRVNGTVASAGQNGIRLLRGVGSGFLASTNVAGQLAYAPAVGGLSTNKTITIESGTAWIGISGTLSGSVVWPAQSRIAITNHLGLNAGADLTIGAGTIVRVHPGVNITNDGSLIINGTVEQPVVFTPVSPAQPWGGFLMWNGVGSITGNGVIFVGSGADANWFGSGGNPRSHRTEQALFFCAGPSRISLTDSAAVFLAGQLGHAVNGGTFTFTRFLMQRTTSGGEFSGASQPLSFAVNDSAFIECPDDSAPFADEDNDALYLVHGTHGFTNTLIGFTKDDGIDCGGSGEGVLRLVDCWFESIFHEGTSLSGSGKQVFHDHNTLLNCGQAVEVGYDAPTGQVAQCLILANLTGARQGDNYSSGYVQDGFLYLTNSILLQNYRDVWGMSFLDWTYRSNQMNIRSNLLSSADPRWPLNRAWSPAGDAARLAEYGYFPHASAVGVGFALRTNRVSLPDLADGLPVRLSRFSTNEVSVDYALEVAPGVVASGTLVFDPGETLKKIAFSIAGLEAHELVSVRLFAPVNAAVTGLPQVFVVKSGQATTLIPPGATWRFLDTGTNLGTAWIGADFSDAAWSSGRAQLGFGDDDEISEVVSNRQVTTYFRHTFNVPNPAAFGSLTVALLRDDGGVVYLNGRQVFRSNLPTPFDYLTLATNALAQDESTFFYTNTITNPVLQLGTNLCAVEIHQSSDTSSDLSFDLQLFGNSGAQLLLKQVRLADGLVLYWEDPAGTLESAQDPAGPWSLVPGAENPFAVPFDVAQRFFRLKR